MTTTIDDLRIRKTNELISPEKLIEDISVSDAAAETVARARQTIHNIISGEDDRLLVIVGPCSIHDPEAAREYARLLKQAADDTAEDLAIVMRVYFEKPRTTVGWKGLINDPDLNNTFQINKGLHLARQLLLDLAEMGLPAGTEYLDLGIRLSLPAFTLVLPDRRFQPAYIPAKVLEAVAKFKTGHDLQ